MYYKSNIYFRISLIIHDVKQKDLNFLKSYLLDSFPMSSPIGRRVENMKIFTISNIRNLKFFYQSPAPSR